jgi:hypothetical protein
MSRLGWDWPTCLAYSWQRARAAKQQSAMDVIGRLINEATDDGGQ